MIFKWSDEYETGIQRIDVQHKMLFKMLDDAVSDLCSDAFDPTLTLKLLRMYAQMHFCFEEDCMLQHACPLRQTNKEQHEHFLEEIDRFSMRFEALTPGPERSLLVKELLDWIGCWLRNHITGTDLALRACVHQAEIDATLPPSLSH